MEPSGTITQVGEPSIASDPLRYVALYGNWTNVRSLSWDDRQTPAAMVVADTQLPLVASGLTLDVITVIDQVTGQAFNTQLQCMFAVIVRR